MLTLMGLAFWWLLFRAFLRWLDVREHARIRGPEHGSIGPLQRVRQRAPDIGPEADGQDVARSRV